MSLQQIKARSAEPWADPILTTTLAVTTHADRIILQDNEHYYYRAHRGAVLRRLLQIIPSMDGIPRGLEVMRVNPDNDQKLRTEGTYLMPSTCQVLIAEAGPNRLRIGSHEELGWDEISAALDHGSTSSEPPRLKILQDGTLRKPHLLEAPLERKRKAKGKTPVRQSDRVTLYWDSKICFCLSSANQSCFYQPPQLWHVAYRAYDKPSASSRLHLRDLASQDLGDGNAKIELVPVKRSSNPPSFDGRGAMPLPRLSRLAKN